MDCYLAANRLEIQKRIIEAQEEYNQKLEESGLTDKEGEQPKSLLDKSRSLVELVSDKLAKSIDPDYERDVHISDIDSREDFRKVSVTAPACDEQIIGHGLLGYVEAVEKIIEKLEKIV